jgi:hypothetical protein
MTTDWLEDAATARFDLMEHRLLTCFAALIVIVNIALFAALRRWPS